MESTLIEKNEYQNTFFVCALILLFSYQKCLLFYVTQLLRTSAPWIEKHERTARAGYDTRSIFKRSLTGLNSEFSFS